MNLYQCQQMLADKKLKKYTEFTNLLAQTLPHGSDFFHVVDKDKISRDIQNIIDTNLAKFGCPAAIINPDGKLERISEEQLFKELNSQNPDNSDDSTQEEYAAIEKLWAWIRPHRR